MYLVNTSKTSRLHVSWSVSGEVSCDCLLFILTRLPYKHTCGMLKALKSETVVEVVQLRPRWSLKEAQALLSLVTSTVKHPRNVSRITGEATHTTNPSVMLVSNKRFAYVRLRKTES
ncbi:hypothetical protein JG688_00001494 [Phytophthora aleatoria]|uniref:Uncharacterized protein n=1 Tax=Phytophthora aleatoria TaxID=2496075 RepID=A0A8J5J3F8_9STRA|nr:hypothetical protein JG688_00001494 [Phytophthora aleatoria]